MKAHILRNLCASDNSVSYGKMGVTRDQRPSSEALTLGTSLCTLTLCCLARIARRA